MSYSALQGPTDLFGVNSALRQRAFPLSGDLRRDSDSHSPTMSEPRSPLFRPSLTAEFPSHLASLYNSPYAAAAVAAAVAGQGSAGVGAPPTFNPYGRPTSTAAFYPGMVSGDAWRRSPYLSQLDFCWPPGLRSLEAVVGPRTKAPREATTILKSWLNEHKDNPYPTKSEKMTLSLVTHMTLTQVSTWFANARRRIKKENKMTWTPKTRCGERDGSSSNEDESEKDYFGRQRSPFSMSRDAVGGDVVAKRISSDYADTKKSMSFDATAPSSSVPFAPNLTRKAPAHPLFAAFSGLQSPYRGLNTSAIEDAFRQKMISTHDNKNEDEKVSGYPKPERIRSPAFKSDTEKYDPRRSPSKVFSARSSFPSAAEQRSPPLGESHTPFVNLKKSRHFGEKDSDGIDLTDADNEQSGDECVIAKRDESNASDSFPVANKCDAPKSEEVSNEKEGDRHKSDGEWSSLQQNAASNLHRTIYMNEMMAKSATNGKMDPLSCWIRDFQHLVASGQEIKAKQALATALAVAAKAGAYSGMGGLQRPAPYYIPRRQSHTERRLSSDESLNEDSLHDIRRSSGSSNRASRLSMTSGSQYDRRNEHGFKSSSPDMERQRTPSPVSPPANTVRLRSPYKGALSVSDDSPMNLSKPAHGKSDWKHANMTAENERAET